MHIMMDDGLIVVEMKARKAGVDKKEKERVFALIITRSTANEPGRLGDQSRWMDRIRSRITKDVIERLWLN